MVSVYGCFCICMYLCYMHVCKCVWVLPCVYVWRGLRTVSGVFLYCCPPYFLQTNSLTGPGAHGFCWTAWPVSPWDSALSVPPAVLSLQASATLPGFPMGTWDPNSVSCVCEAGVQISPMQPSLQASMWGFNNSQKVK